MKQVDIIFGGWINAVNGASSVVRILADYSKLFEDFGIHCNFYTNDTYWPIPNTGGQSNETRLRKLSYNIKKYIKSLLKLFPVLSAWITIYRTLLSPAKSIASRYVENEDQHSTDPIFFHEIFTCYYYLKLSKAKRPVIITLHNNGDTFKMISIYYPQIIGTWVMNRLNRIEKFTLNRVEKICFVANQPKTTFISLHPTIDPQKVEVVYNGIPQHGSKLIHTNDNRNYFELCCVGSITYRKGQDIIIDAIAALSDDEKKKIHVTFIGDGSKRAEFEKMCADKGITNYVKFVGNQNDVNSWLKKSDIFILTSRDEGLPMAILEAQRVGLPIISTKIAGIPEMINNGESGILINPDKKELIEILKNISQYDWKQMGEKSKEIFNNKFTANKMVEGYAEILNRL